MTTEQESIRSQFAHALASELHCGWDDIDPQKDIGSFENLVFRMEKYEAALDKIATGDHPFEAAFLAQDALA